jgi:magnesium transporter
VRQLKVAHTTARNEIRRRAPWIVLALVAGIAMVFVADNFETVFSRNIQLAFFLPVIVYMSDSIGTETLALFVRELDKEGMQIHRLLLREATVGLSLGLLSGIPMGAFGAWWFEDTRLGLTLALAMTVNGLVAVLTGMMAPFVFAKLGKDPALGSDELTTAVSDNASMLVYLMVAMLVLF